MHRSTSAIVGRGWSCPLWLLLFTAVATLHLLPWWFLHIILEQYEPIFVRHPVYVGLAFRPSPRLWCWRWYRPHFGYHPHLPRYPYYLGLRCQKIRSPINYSVKAYHSLITPILAKLCQPNDNIELLLTTRIHFGCTGADHTNLTLLRNNSHPPAVTESTNQDDSTPPHIWREYLVYQWVPNWLSATLVWNIELGAFPAIKDSIFAAEPSKALTELSV